MAKASDTMKATFCFSKAIPSSTAITPSATVVMRETFSYGGASRDPFASLIKSARLESAA